MNLEDSIKRQYPSLFITLLSVLVGLVFSDLVSQAHERMTLWPLDVGTLRTWGQLLSMGTNTLATWAFLAHLNISRHKIPGLEDSLVVFLLPIPLLIANCLIGLKDVWPWFYFASFYLFICVITVHTQVRMQAEELKRYADFVRPFGPTLVIAVGIPFFAGAGWADARGLVSPIAEVIISFIAAPWALLFTWFFFRSWKRAIADDAAAGER